MLLRIKRGATFRHVHVFPADLTGFTITGQARRDNVVTNFVVRLLDPTTAKASFVEISVPAATTDTWPLGTMKADLKFVMGDEVVYTETLIIQVLEEITP